MVKYPILFVLLFFETIVFSQTNPENKLKILFDKLQFAENDDAKDSLNTVISSELEKFISEKDISGLEGIKNLSVLISEDKKVAFFTWPVLYSDFTYKYYGFVRYYETDFNRYAVEKLSDKSETIVNPERQTLNPENWYGAFYYKLIYKRYKKNKQYVLLGWDGNDDLTTKKTVDIFYIDENGEPAFGKDVFESEDGIKKRLIFEYKEGISMSLRYDKKKDMIIWDHLSPSQPELTGHYEYYGPDLTFDALKFEKGIWKYIPDIDLSK